ILGQHELSGAGMRGVIRRVALDDRGESSIGERSRGQTQGAVDCNVAAEGFSSAAARGEVVVGEDRNGLRPAVEIDRAIGEGIGIGTGGEDTGDTNGSAGGQNTGAGGAAGAVGVVEGGNGLGAGAESGRA